jgi:hypothetical protein
LFATGRAALFLPFFVTSFAIIAVDPRVFG